MKTIPLNGGYVAFVDDEDYELVSPYKWSTLVTGNKIYARRSEGPRRNQRQILMHKAILKSSQGELIDHKDGDGLNNCRDNLRTADRSLNAANSCRSSANTSGYKGVSVSQSKRRWRAYIRVNNVCISLGHFDLIEEAAKAYDAAARKYFGEFAKTNFPI
jgi:hypothetical protein